MCCVHTHTQACLRPNLYFHGHLPAVLHLGQVNLAYRGCCKWTFLKRLQLVSPVRTQVAVQCFLQMQRSHIFQTCIYRQLGVRSEFKLRNDK